MVSHQVENEETVESSKCLKHTWQSSLKLKKIQQVNNEEMKKLGSLLGYLDKPTGACSLALSDTPSFSFCINASNKVYDDS